MAEGTLYARIRKEDDVLREHFSNVKKADHAFEVRRLLEKAILIERKEQEILQKDKKSNK
jgi:hypothetical protein